MLGRSAERYLDTQRAAHLRRMRELTARKREGDLVDALFGRSWPLPPRGRSSVDRHDGGSAARIGRGGGVVSTASGSDVMLVRGTVLEARNLFLSFGETPALRGASLAVKKGEILAMMGPSGSGKSTLLHCLAGILVPDSGEIHVDGDRLVDTMSEKQRSALRRDRFGFVFQFGQLVPELTAEENVALPLLLGGTRRQEALRVARTWFERLQLDGLERHRSGEMSGGQAQRVALWRVEWSPSLRCSSPTNRRDHWIR